jgi:hypothetical protein
MNTGYNNIKFVDPRLARYIPTDFEHVDKYPLTAATLPSAPVPVTIGVNWYSDFDTPIKKDGRWMVGLDPNRLGSIRGGHCVCIPHDTTRDLYSWVDFYNQGFEGACVGFGTSRSISLVNREKYNAWWMWNRAKMVDEWPDTNPGDDNGTSVRAAMDILRLNGHVKWRTGMDHDEQGRYPADYTKGIQANRWARNMDDVLDALGSDRYKKMGLIPFLNSWGRDYPHIVWSPVETWDRLLKEDGEFAIITDR